MGMLRKITILFLVVNALFWGLATHKQHCDLAAMFGIKKCTAHWILVWVMGLGSFILALYLRQGSAGLFRR